jgi:hypothetical protein
MEAEDVAAIEDVRDALWLRSLLTKLGFKQTKATVIHIFVKFTH